VIVKVGFRGPEPRAMFSPSFLTWVAEHRFPYWRLAGDLLHHTDQTGNHWVWRLGTPDPRKLGYTLGVWPD
jgi:hypothetical protein